MLSDQSFEQKRDSSCFFRLWCKPCHFSMSLFQIFNIGRSPCSVSFHSTVKWSIILKNNDEQRYFSNSLTIQLIQVNTKKITTAKEVWYSVLISIDFDASLLLRLLLSFRFDWEHHISNTRDSVSSAIQTPLQTHFSVSGYPDETLSIYYIKVQLAYSQKFSTVNYCQQICPREQKG